MNRPIPAWISLVPVAAASCVAAPAAATTYLTVEAAQRLMFPGAAMIDRRVALDPLQYKAIARAAGVGSFDKLQHVWEARNGGRRSGWFILDRVLGKHELITYAVALATDGAVRRVEILDYRETYGGEIRDARWRQQFVGRRPGQSLRLGKDIQNISGATLSSRHVTDGVRRILLFWDMILKNG